MIINLLMAAARDRRGVSAIEYGLLGTFVVVGVIAGISRFMEAIAPLFRNLGAAVGLG